MKRLIAIVFVLSLLVPLSSAYAKAKESVEKAQLQETQTRSALSDFEIKDNIIVNYVGRGGNVVIPSGIVGIKSYAFSNETAITSVIIPDSVTEIGNSAFYNCTGIQKVVIGNGVRNIGNSAFSNNKGMTSLTIGNSVEKIGDSAFNNCVGLKNLILPDSVRVIDSGAFQGCSGLIGIRWSEKLTEIGSYSFADLPGLKTVKLPNSLKTIGSNSFYGSNITILEFGNQLREIGSYAFSDTRIKSLKLPNSVVSIGHHSFYNIPTLESVVIGDGITNVSSSAFSNNKSLKSVTLGKNVSVISDHAFDYSSSLTTIKFNSNLKEIESSAFYASGLKTVAFNSGLTSIGSSAFSNTNLISVDMLDTITYVGRSAFENCEYLKSVKLSRSLTEVSSHAFYGCSSLTEINIPNSITSIKGNAFYGCTSLKKVIIGKGVTTLSDGSFGETKSLKEIYIPSNVTVIGNIFSRSWWSDPNDAVIIGERNSQAYTFALENGHKFRVNTPVKSISLPFSIKTIEVGKSYTFKTTINPSYAGDTSLKYSLGNYTIANVDSFGKVTGLKPGSTYLTVTSSNGKTAKCLIKVVNSIYPKSISFNATKVGMTVGSVYQTTVKVNPGDALYKTITYSSSNPKVAKVTSDGKISALKTGTATITAKSANGLKSSIVVTVKAAPVTSIKFPVSVQSITLGKSVNLAATAYPSYAQNKAITYSVGNAKIAKVDAKGKVTAVGIGNTYLYAKASNGVTAKIAIKVLPASPTSVAFNTSVVRMKKNTTYSSVVIVYPKYASDKRVTFRTGNSKIATVDKNGKVTARNVGNTYLYVTTWNGKTSRIAISVK